MISTTSILLVHFFDRIHQHTGYDLFVFNNNCFHKSAYLNQGIRMREFGYVPSMMIGFLLKVETIGDCRLARPACWMFHHVFFLEIVPITR